MRPSEPEGPGAWWQMPQGGIDEGEDPAQAALRELYEETGIRSVEIDRRKPALVHLRLAAGAGAQGLGRALSRPEAEVVRAALRRRARTRSPSHGRRASDRVRRLALGGHGRADRPDRALQARRLRAGRAGFRARCAKPTSADARVRNAACPNPFTLLGRFCVTKRANHCNIVQSPECIGRAASWPLRRPVSICPTARASASC